MNDQRESSLPVTTGPSALATGPQPPVNDWQVLGDTFETMGKIGLAMTVGFAAAGAFCKMVESGSVKLPNLATLLAPSVNNPRDPA